MDKLLDVVDMLRNHYRFQGYIHLKVMPGASTQYVEAAYRLGTRLSVNIETPTQEGMERLSTMKDFSRDILEPMSAIHRLTREDGTGASGQVTQMVVGAADESDWEIYQRMEQLYTQWGFKRVYYQAFRPARYTPLEEHPATPMLRAHRLYQLDWLSRIYGYTREELRPTFDAAGFLALDADPKLLLALEQGRDGPLDINAADYRQLLRVPGIGPVAAKRIVANRSRHTIDTWRDLQAMGVVVKRAKSFVGFPGYRPERSQQLKLELFQERSTPNRSPSVGGGGCASCAPMPAADVLWPAYVLLQPWRGLPLDDDAPSKHPEQLTFSRRVRSGKLDGKRSGCSAVGSAPRLGRGGPGFKSRHPDQVSLPASELTAHQWPGQMPPSTAGQPVPVAPALPC